MKSFILSTGLAILVAFSQLAHAYYACTLNDAVPLSSLLSSSESGSSTGTLTAGSNITPNSPGCSFYIAAGGTCTTEKIKRDSTLFPENLATPHSANLRIEVLRKRTTYSTLPCLDSMSCVTVSGELACFDLNANTYIDNEGTCGNLNTGETETGCVAKFLAEQSGSASATAIVTATGVKVTQTASGTSSTVSSASANAQGVSNTSGGARVALASVLGLVALSVGYLVVSYEV